MAKKTFHPQANGVTVVKEHGKIVTNLPGAGALTAPTSAPATPTRGLEQASTDTPSYLDAYQAFSAGAREAYAADIADLDARIAAVKQESEQAVADNVPFQLIPLASLGTLRAEHDLPADTMLTHKEAIDLYRLDKAILREQHTLSLQSQDAANGISRLSAYGDGDLGVAKVEAMHEPNTREWLLARTQGLGGSDKIGYVDETGTFQPYDAVDKKHYVYGVLKSKTPAAVAALMDAPLEAPDEKTSPVPIRIGNHLERTIQYEFAVNNPQYAHLEDKNTRTAPNGRSYHRFNPDGVLQDKATGEYGIFEAKTSRDSETFDKAVPGYLAQCLHNAAAADLPFAVLVADVEGEPTQRVIRMDFTPAQRQHYRDALDRVWLLYKPAYDKRPPTVEAVTS